MKNVYLILAIVGFIAPSILVFMESVETGNVLLYTNPIATIDGMFASRISTIFMIDLLFAVLVFFVWTFIEAKRHGIKSIWLVWLLTMLLGLAGGFPFFLYLREKAIEIKTT
tara:strand:- start:104 stop:439 length:336 start_codon:yes stop_codon:yes gene_type:complete